MTQNALVEFEFKLSAFGVRPRDANTPTRLQEVQISGASFAFIAFGIEESTPFDGLALRLSLAQRMERVARFAQVLVPDVDFTVGDTFRETFPGLQVQVKPLCARFGGKLTVCVNGVVDAFAVFEDEMVGTLGAAVGPRMECLTVQPS